MQLEAERAHLVLSELARVRNALAVQTTTDPTPARDAERKRVVTALKELVAAFRDVGADAWFTRDLSWVRRARKRKRSARARRAAPRSPALSRARPSRALHVVSAGGGDVSRDRLGRDGAARGQARGRRV